MKKLTCTLLSVLLVLALCITAQAEVVYDYTGDWACTGIEMSGIAMDPSALGIQMTMTLNADGTCAMNAMGQSEAGTWALTETGITTTDSTGVVDAFTRVDDALTAEMDGMKIVFTRPGAAAAPVEEVPAATAPVDVANYDFTGDWTCTGIEMSGIAMDPSALGIQMTMTLNADGTCVLSAMGQTETGSWAPSETGITTTDANGTTDAYILMNDTLTAEADGMKVIFTRADAVAPVEEAPAVTAPADLANYDFTGDWTCTSIELAGMSMDPTAMGMTMTMTLNADGTCILSAMGETDAGTWAPAETGITTTDSTGVTDTYTFVGDALTVEMEGMKIVFTRGGAAAPVTTDAAATAPVDTSDVDYVGYWACTSVEAAGMQLDPSLLGVSLVIVLNEDGTCIVNSEEGQQAGLWTTTETGVSLTDETQETMDMVYAEDGTLSITEEGIKMIFTLIEGAEVRANVPMSDFLGTWVLDHAEISDGQFFSPEELALAYRLVLAEEGSTITVTSEGETETYALTLELTEEPDFGTVLFAHLYDPLAPETPAGTLMLMLYDDGQLVSYEYEEENDLEVYYCFNPEVVAE